MSVWGGKLRANNEIFSAASEVPDWTYLDASLVTFAIGDPFGNNVGDLIKELRGSNNESIWAKRLALYEIARRRAWINSFLALPEEARSGLVSPYFTIHEMQRISKPGKVVSWVDLDEIIKDREINFEHGSYRSVPTMAHVGYVNYGTNPLGANINVLSIEAASVIKGRKGPETIVLDDDLRTTLWRHVPGVDAVFVMREYDPNNAQSFWVDEVYPHLAQVASRMTLMCSYAEQIAQETTDYARKAKNMDVRLVLREHWHRDFGNPLYPEWSTTQWDQVSEEHEKFETMARQHLVL